MKRIAWMAVLLLLAGFVGTAQAQVATTDLVPAAPTFPHPNATGSNTANLTPDNPAAVAWGMPSRVGFGLIKGTDTFPGSPTLDYKGNFGGVRLVGSTLGFAAEQILVKDDTGLGTTLDQSNDVQVSANIGNWLALGIGGGKDKTDTPPNVHEISRKEVGASVRLNDVWYLGLAAYKDEDSLPGSPTTYKRDGALAGIALRTEGPWRWYVAYDYSKLKNFNYTTPGGGLEQNRFTVQLLAGPVLLGASTTKYKVLDTTGTPPSVKYNAVDIGWAPMTGLTVTARAQKTEATSAGLTEDVKTNSVAVAWQF